MNTHFRGFPDDLQRLLQQAGLPKWAGYVAQDADGQWWVFEAEPNQHHCGWYENEVGRCQSLGAGRSNPTWKSSLLPASSIRD